jgi:hypothetical protein
MKMSDLMAHVKAMKPREDKPTIVDATTEKNEKEGS